MCEGSLEPVAEAMFALPYDVFLVEWDDVGRDGGFEALRLVPTRADRRAGNRLVEDPRARARGRPRSAAWTRRPRTSRSISSAISPQCGFASVVEGNDIDEDTQWRKLELVARVADRVWSWTAAASRDLAPDRLTSRPACRPADGTARPLTTESGPARVCTSPVAPRSRRRSCTRVEEDRRPETAMWSRFSGRQVDLQTWPTVDTPGSDPEFVTLLTRHPVEPGGRLVGS